MHILNPPADAGCMLRGEALRFSYGGHCVLRDLSFAVSSGECAVLAGPNGSGKSTVLSLAAGVLRPSAGSLTAAGRIGYVPQGTALLEDATVAENLRFFADLLRVDVPAHLPFAVEEFKKRRVSALSGGMKKQVSIACAMLGDPEILLLDEPCAALDISFREEMLALLHTWKREGRTVLYAGHDPAEFYPVCDRLIFLGDPPKTFTRTQTPDFWESESLFTRRFAQLFAKSKTI